MRGLTRLAHRGLVIVMVGLLLVTSPASAETQEESSADSRFSYGKQGLQYDDGTGNNFLWFGVRAQTRWSGSRVTEDELPGAPISTDSELDINRARLKLGGHLVRPEFTIYSEYDLVGERLLDLRAT